jgi:hypothetical protein
MAAWQAGELGWEREDETWNRRGRGPSASGAATSGAGRGGGSRGGGRGGRGRPCVSGAGGGGLACRGRAWPGVGAAAGASRAWERRQARWRHRAD